MAVSVASSPASCGRVDDDHDQGARPRRPAGPQRHRRLGSGKSALSAARPRRAAVSFAPSTAWGTTSTPTRRRQSGSIESLMVPMPQYRSSKKSSGFSAADSRALAYSTLGGGGVDLVKFTPIRRETPERVSSIYPGSERHTGFSTPKSHWCGCCCG